MHCDWIRARNPQTLWKCSTALLAQSSSDSPLLQRWFMDALVSSKNTINILTTTTTTMILPLRTAYPDCSSTQPCTFAHLLPQNAPPRQYPPKSHNIPRNTQNSQNFRKIVQSPKKKSLPLRLSLNRETQLGKSKRRPRGHNAHITHPAGEREQPEPKTCEPQRLDNLKSATPTCQCSPPVPPAIENRPILRGLYRTECRGGSAT